MASKSKNNKKQNNKMQMKILIGIGVLAVAVFIIGAIISTIADSRAKAKREAAQAAAESAMAVAEAEAKAMLQTSADDLSISHYADIDIEDYGTVTVALDETAAPETVANFVKLANDGFYDGLTFHRIIDGFMMQGGDPLGNGTGGSEENIKGEFNSNGFANNISHVRGAISMARSSSPDSASSQFFIVQSDSDFLDGEYAGFGFVTEGMDIVDKVCKDAQPTDNNGTIAAKDQPKIKTITIREAGSETAGSAVESVENTAE